MTEVTSNVAITSTELRTKRNFRNDPAYKAAYAAEMKAKGKAAAHQRYKMDAVAAKIARADAAKKLKAATA